MINSEDNLLIDSRFKELKNFFHDLDENHDNVLSFEELGNLIDKKSGKKFNNDLLNEIFRTMDRDQNSHVDLEEFISGFCKAESLIVNKIDMLKSQVLSSTRNLSDAKRQLLESKARKSENVLSIKVMNAVGLKPNGISGLKGPVVSITCEGQEIITNPADPNDLQWNESFSFHITQGTGDIWVQVFDLDRKKHGNPIGVIAIPLELLRDQQIHSELFELKSEGLPERTTGKIMMELNWVYDLPRFLEGIIEEYNFAIKEDKEELEQMEFYLREMQLPVYNGAAVQGSTQLESQIVSKIDNIYQHTIGEKIQWKTLTEIMLYSFLTISTITMLLRPDFFNVNFN